MQTAIKSLIVDRKTLIIAILVSFLVLILSITSLFATPLYAQNCEKVTVGEKLTDEQLIEKINKCAIEKDIFDDKVFNFNQLSGTADSIYILLLGESRLHPELNDATENQSALNSSGRVLAAMYKHPPASGIQYASQQLRKFNPTQPAYAQEGIGYETLKPVQKLWEAFRNVAYIGFVIVFVIAGFMIMFRAHISPQAVATVQDSLPRIVIALVLVTFSYAIAGFMIDLMFLFINVAINLFPGLHNTTDPNDPNFTNNAQNIFRFSVLKISGQIWDTLAIEGGQAIGDLIGNVISGVPGIIKDLFQFAGGVIGGVIIAAALLFVTFRIFFMLLVSYVSIIVLTIFAPFFFLVQALPGQNGGREWFKQMAGNLSVFATISIMFLLAAYFGGIKELGGEGSAGTAISGELTKFPLLIGGIDADAILKIVGFGFIFFSPEAAKMVKDWITQGKAQAPAGSAALAGGMGMVGGALASGGRSAGKQAGDNIPGFSAWRRASAGKKQALAEAEGRKHVAEKRPDLVRND